MTIKKDGTPPPAIPEDRYRLISENMRDMICLHAVDGTYQYVSPSVKELLGYGPEELIGKNPFDFFHPHDVASAKEKAREPALKKNEKVSTQYRFRKKDGRYAWLETLTRPLKNETGEVVQFLTASRDISGRVLMEKLLRYSEMKFKEQFRNIPLPTFTWQLRGDDFHLIDCNLAADAFLDEPAGTHIGVTAPVFFKTDAKALAALLRCFKSRTNQILEHVYPLKKKNEIRELVSTFVHVDPDIVMHHIEDVTEKKRYELKARTLAKFPEENPYPVIRVSTSGAILYANRASGPLLRIWNTHAGNSLPPFWLNILSGVVEGKKPREVEVNAGDRIYLFSITPVTDLDECYIYGMDISDKRMKEKELYLTSRIFETTMEGIIVTDSTGAIQFANPAFTKITGFELYEVQGKNPRILKSNRHDAKFYREMWKSISETGQWEGEIWNRRKNGEIYPQCLSLNAIRDDIGQVQNYVAVFNDISEVKRQEARIEHQAYHDPLTELPNKNLLDDRLDRAIAQAKRNNRKLALIFIDLDRFKNINDSLGHIVGDALLVEVSKRLAACIRDVDTVSRIGGDEFVVLLTNIDDASDITIVTDRIIDSFTEPFRIKDHELFAAPSMGITVFPEDGGNTMDLYRNADIAMYDSKKSGGNRYHFYSNRMNDDVSKKLLIENKLRRAIDNGELRLHYQPIVKSTNGEIIGAEALIRWQNPDLGLVSPADFIPLAEETGLIVPINDWVLARACQDNRSWQDMKLKEIYVSVNMTSHQFMKRKIIESVSNALKWSGLNPRCLIVEITENSLMGNVDEIIDIMKELKKTGIRFSIDDFGTGYSSLSYLKKFPLDNLKVDKSFVDDMLTNNESMAIAKTIIALGKNLSLFIVSEGVETLDQLKFFQENSGDYIQGYYFSKPVPYEEFTVLLRKGKFILEKEK